MEKTYHFIKTKSSKLLIVFSAAGTITHRYNFWSAGHSMSCHVLYLKEKYEKNYFYQHGIAGIGDIEESIAFIKQYCKENGITQIYTVGQSMGAYGALHYGCLLDARVLLFSPLVRAEHSPKLDKNTVIAESDLYNLVEQSKVSIQMYTGELDPIDLYNARLLYNLPNVTAISLSNVNHGVASFFLAKKKLTNILLTLVEDANYPKLANEGDAIRYQKYCQNLYRSQLLLDKEKYAEALNAAQVAISTYYIGSQAHLIAGMSCYKLGDYAEAAPYFATATAILPSVESSFYFASSMRNLGQHSVAIKLHLKNLEKHPGHEDTIFDLCQIFKEKKNNIQAIKYCILALEKNADEELYKQELRLLTNHYLDN